MVKNTTSHLLSGLFAFLLVFSISSLSAQDIEAGKTLFRNNCASCHNKDMKSKMTGPALGGVQQRWAEYPKEDLYSWIRNSQAMVASGHPLAVKLWNEWKPTVMNNFPSLTDADIDNVLAYVDAVYTGKTGGETAAATEVKAPVVKKPNFTWLYVLLLGVLAVMAVVLAKIIANLDFLSKVREGEAHPVKKTLSDMLTHPGIIGFLIFAGLVVVGYVTVSKSINFGRQKDYQPDQPIKYSHRIHAGVNKIDCNFCHDGARRSKHAVIPAASTCMNCHAGIKKGSEYGTAELTKLFASNGFNPNTGKYIPNYENYPEDSIEIVFKKWIGDTYAAENGGQVDQRFVDNQWNDVVESLTGPGDEKIAGPIEWVRINNLPDHVYFNHSQHVSVGKIACQTCHGPIETMEVVKQQAPLSMGWCINCHRKTEVKFAENGYYDNYFEKYHKEIAEKKRSKVTVEDIGGLGCQKCHY
jgi:cytochrome c2